MDTSKEKEFQKRLLATFKIEAAEHVEAISSGILNLEKANDAMQAKGIVEIVFREAHSLKGAARAVNMEQIENICKLLESVFMLVKQEQLQLDPTAYDRMHLSLDFITGLLESSEEMGIEDGNGDVFFGLLDKLEEIIEGEIIKTDQPEIVRINESINEPINEPINKPINEPEVVRKQHQETPVQNPSSETQPTKETIRVPILKLDDIMRQAEELISLKLKLAQHNIDLNGQQIQLGNLKKSVQRKLQIKEKSISGSGSKKTRELVLGDHEGRKMSKSLLNDIYQELCLVESNMSFVQEIFESNLREVGSQVNHLMHDVRQTLMTPCSSLTELLPKLVRELSRDQGKEARLEIFGDEYELDRRIIERLKDPMIHLIRNAIDHGLEKPEERMQKGKSREGLIRVYITPAGGNMLEFSITDDGKGFDLEAVRTEIAKSTELSDIEISQLRKNDLENAVFESGFSTSKIITDISGRGLGMAIVREEVDLLGGRVVAESNPGVGSTIKLLIPHSFGNFRGIGVEVSGEEFVIPARNIENIIRIEYSQISTIDNREIIRFKDENLLLLSLSNILGITSDKEKDGSNRVVLILRSGSRGIAVSVDELLKEQEILIKPFPPPLTRVRHFEGATVLGTGKVVMIVNVQDIINDVNLGLLSGGRRVRQEKLIEKQKRVLIAEDSMTARMLLKDILESAGFDVRAAVDGAEAYTMLKKEKPDILVSDVEMPGKNGFELTAAIRADKDMSELPVILVTALKTQKDREMGMEAGANAYIEKGKFDPGALLAIINKLI